jgi:hypothetical protein
MSKTHALTLSLALCLAAVASGCSAEVEGPDEASEEGSPEAAESESNLGFETLIKIYDVNTSRPITWEQCMADTTGLPFVYFEKTDFKMTCLRLRVHVLERHHSPILAGKTGFDPAKGWTPKDVAALISGVIRGGQRRETKFGPVWQRNQAFRLQNGRILKADTYCVYGYKGSNQISTVYPKDPILTEC